MHFFDFLERGNGFRVPTFMGLWTLFAGALWLVSGAAGAIFKAAWNKRYWLLAAAVGSALFLVFFMRYQRLPEFTTRHELVIENPDGVDWKGVEILGVRRADFSEFAPDALVVEGSAWQGESSILLGGGGKLRVQEVFKGGVEIRLRAGPEAGNAVLRWDGNQQMVNLYAPQHETLKVDLDGYSWGQLSRARAILVYTARAADFIAFFSLMMILIAFFIAAISRLEPNEEAPVKLRLNWQDGITLSVFLAIAIILTLNQAAGSFNRYTSLSGDAGNYASFAAALRFPELFTRDPLLSDPARFGFFATFHIPFINMVYPLFGNFGSAFFVLELPTIFLQLSGFYLLGRQLYRSRLFGVLLTGLCFVFFQINLSEFWGFVASPIARFSFQAALPFVLLFTLAKGRYPRWWPLVMAAAGGLVYVHAVSAPAWSVAIAFALWFMPDSTFTWKRKIGWALLAMLIFSLILVPFAQDYFGNTHFGDIDEQDLTQVQNIIRYRHAEGMIDIGSAIDGFFNTAIASHWINVVFFTLAFVSLLGMLWLHFRNGDVPYSISVVCFLAGLVSISILFPMVDFSVAQLLNRNPLQIQFLRTLRNYFPLVFLSALWPLAYAYQCNKLKLRNRAIAAVFGILLLTGWGWRTEFMNLPVVAKTWQCWINKSVVCPEPESDPRAEFFEAVYKLTPPGSTILAEDLAVRYYALRPLIFSKKDGATFAFSDHNSLLNWYPKSLRFDEINRLREDKSAFAQAYWQFADELGADYVVLETEGFKGIPAQFSMDKIIFQNHLFTLVKTNL